MPYIRKGTPPGRPKVYQTDADRPVKITACLPRELYGQLERAAKTQQTSQSACVVQALERYLDGFASDSGHLDVIDTALTATAKALGALEAAISPDHPLMTHVNALYESLTPIADVLMTLHPEEAAS